jgi:predicted phage tail protein
MVIVWLIGTLGNKFGHEWRLDIHSPGEAIRAIASQVDGFAEYLNQSQTGYELVLDGSPIDETQLDRGIRETLSIVPVIAGSGATASRIIGGAVLLGASFFLPAAGVLGISSVNLGLFGASMIAGGIVDLLSPDKPGNQDSFLVDGASINRAVQGSPVPVLFGERFIQPLPISIWVDNENINVDFVP